MKIFARNSYKTLKRNKHVHIKSILCTALLLCSQLAIAGKQTAGTQQDAAMSIYQNSSAEVRIEQIAPQIRKHFLSMGVKPTHGGNVLRKEILSAIEISYHPSRFQKHIIASINNTLTSRERAKVLSWFNSRIGQKASLSEANTMMNAYIEGIPSVIDNAKRLKLPNDTETLIDTTEMAAMESELQLDVAVYQTSASSFAANAPQAQPGTNDYQIFFTATNSRRDEISKLNNNFARAMLGLALEDFSDTEIKALISFWGSPTGTRYSVALRRGINDAFRQSNRRFEREVKTIIANNRKQELAVLE